MCQIVFAKANRPHCKKTCKNTCFVHIQLNTIQDPCMWTLRTQGIFLLKPPSQKQSAPFAFKRKNKALVLHSGSAYKNNLLYSLTSVEQTYSRAKDPVAKNKPPTVRSSAKLQNSIRFNKPLLVTGFFVLVVNIPLSSLSRSSLASHASLGSHVPTFMF